MKKTFIITSLIAILSGTISYGDDFKDDVMQIRKGLLKTQEEQGAVSQASCETLYLMGKYEDKVSTETLYDSVLFEEQLKSYLAIQQELINNCIEYIPEDELLKMVMTKVFTMQVK